MMVKKLQNTEDGLQKGRNSMKQILKWVVFVVLVFFLYFVLKEVFNHTL